MVFGLIVSGQARLAEEQMYSDTTTRSAMHSGEVDVFNSCWWPAPSFTCDSGGRSECIDFSTSYVYVCFAASPSQKWSTFPPPGDITPKCDIGSIHPSLNLPTESDLLTFSPIRFIACYLDAEEQVICSATLIFSAGTSEEALYRST